MTNTGIQKENSRLNIVCMVLAVLTVFILIYIQNYLYPLYADDWNYSFVHGEEATRIRSFSHIFTSQYNHYMTWGGRSVVHFIAESMLMTGFFWACVINSLGYVLFVYVLYRIANKGNKTNPVLFFLFSLLIWFAQPAYFATILWKTGAANYLWGTLIILLFLYSYYSCYRSRKTENSAVRTVLFFLFGIIAGWTNENMSVALIFYIIASLALYKYEKIKIPAWAITGLIGTIVGCIMMLVAPGNYVRLEDVTTSFGQTEIMYKDIFLMGVNYILTHTWNHLLIPFIVYLFLVFIYIKYPKNENDKQTIIRSSIMFILMAAVALAAMVVSPIFPERALFGIIILLLIAIGIIIANIDFSLKQLKYPAITVFFALAVIYAFQYKTVFNNLSYITAVWDEREIYMAEQKRMGNDSITFTKKFELPPEYYISDLSDDPEYWENKCYVRFYGLKQVRLIVSKPAE
ncbi:DUF6056 family protein [Prevotella sp. 10(H)]|uniref:DUF3329 domain-containing protein n=1 Tax=Prevotella sp. 10(H) TaxID=1158294 RepID=UPI0006923EEC|nr:DUF6056 family protein [Prevotella sp. 10(H)]